MSIAKKLTTIADNMQNVRYAGYVKGYDDGRELGKYEGEQSGIKKGKQEEYDRFWNGYQENGNRRNYAYGFTRRGWNDETYKPKYPVIVTGNAEQMYRESRIKSLSGVDTSGATSVYIAFYNADFETIDKLDFSKATNTQNAFAHSTKLHTIGELVSSETTVWHTTTFDNCAALKNLNITGTIATNFTCSISTLTHDSLMSIINILKDFSTEGGTHTCKIGSTNLGKLTAAEKAIATQKGWTLS